MKKTRLAHLKIFLSLSFLSQWAESWRYRLYVILCLMIFSSCSFLHIFNKYIVAYLSVSRLPFPLIFISVYLKMNASSSRRSVSRASSVLSGPSIPITRRRKSRHTDTLRCSMILRDRNIVAGLV